jgi:hypothetical protein
MAKSKQKRGPLSKVEAFYVLHNYPTIDSATIAVDLDRPVSAIDNFIKKNVVKEKEMHSLNASEQFHHHKGSTVMTENASTLADELKKQVISSKQNCITTIKNDG